MKPVINIFMCFPREESRVEQQLGRERTPPLQSKLQHLPVLQQLLKAEAGSADPHLHLSVVVAVVVDLGQSNI